MDKGAGALLAKVGIPSAVCSLNYVTIEDAVKAVMDKGAGALLAKVDNQNAYWSVPVHPDDRWLLGTMWENALYIDTALPFGLRSAPKIFNALADAVEWMLKQEGIEVVLHYLDDFLLVGAPNSSECERALSILLWVFGELGLPVATNKSEGPATQLTFLGFKLDSVQLEFRLPAKKVATLQMMITEWLDHRSCTRKELESLVGSLGHAGRVVQPGKTFLRRMFELPSIPKKPHHFVRLNASFRSDLLWWHTFLAPLNGISLPRRFGPLQVQAQFTTDASSSVGCGAVYHPYWLQYKWGNSPYSGVGSNQEDSITYQELLPIIFACAVWGCMWQNTSVAVQCDNQGAVAVVNSGYSKTQPIMHLLRCLFFIQLRYNISLHAVYLPRTYDVLADAISRDHLSFFFSQVPAAVSCRTPLPPSLCTLLMHSQPDWTSHRWTQLFSSCFPPA